MANAFTGGASGAAWDLLTETAYDRAVEYYLRDQPQWRQLIDKRPERLAMPGDTITETIHNPFASLATTPLTETVDPDAVAAPAPTRVNVTIQEWGQASLTTLRLKELAFTRPDQEIVELIGRHMYDTMDAIVQAVADAGTNVLYVNGGDLATSGGSVNSVVATDKLQRASAAAAPALLTAAKVMPKVGTQYLGVINPRVSYDLQAENSATAWTAPHTYGGDTGALYSGVVGDFMGVKYIETTRTTVANNSNSVPVYSTYYFGKQALIEVPVIAPHIVIGPQTDKLKRFFPIGWHAMAGYSIFRPQALITCKTSSSLAGL